MSIPTFPKWARPFYSLSIRRKYVVNPNDDPLIAVTAFNKSRDEERVCKACFTWFRRGEHVFRNPGRFDDFQGRPLVYPHQAPDDVAKHIDIQSVGLIPLLIVDYCTY